MFINIENDFVIQSSQIIAMIDYELISSSLQLQEMIEQAKHNNQLKGPTEDVKSVIVTTEGTYFSTLSVTTLKKRTSMKVLLKNLDDYTEH